MNWDIFTFLLIVIIISCIIGIIYIACIMVYRLIETRRHIPKIIWTYWDGDIPPLISWCINTWMKYNPDHKIILLNNDKIPKFIKNLRHAKYDAVRRSDYIRLYMLQKYGGIWMDASIICNGPLPINYDKDFECYYLDTATTPGLKTCSPVLESWFIACKPGNPFVKKWYKEFMSTNRYKNIDDYLDSVEKKGIIFDRINNPDYLTIHVSAQVVLQDYPCYFNISARKAEFTAFRYLFDNKWDSEKAVKALLRGEYKDQPIIKLRGIDRRIFEQYVKIE